MRGSVVSILALLLLIAALPNAALAAKPAGPISIQLLAFNDFHGNLKPPSGSSGRIATSSGNVDAGGLESIPFK